MFGRLDTNSYNVISENLTNYLRASAPNIDETFCWSELIGSIN